MKIIKIKNSNKFREPILRFLETGRYSPYPDGTLSDYNYWLEERNRSIYGYTADDGDWISGYNYFYLNYCQIERLVRKEIKYGKNAGEFVEERQTFFPDFYDYDYNYFLMCEKAETSNKHMVVLKKRGSGYSFKAAAMLCRNYFCIEKSKSYAVAANTEFLLKDGILTKAWDIMDFIDSHTGFAKRRDKSNSKLERVASYIETDEYGRKIEKGYKSAIIGISTGDSTGTVRGKRGKLYILEEAGCHIAGTKVIMSDGSLKNVEDVKIGDKLLGPDNTERSVLELHSGEDDMYKIKPINGIDQIVNSSHIIYGKRRDWNKKTYEDFLNPAHYHFNLLSKKPNHKQFYSLVKTDKINWDKKDLYLDPYFIGLWLGDGDSSDSSISNNDMEVVEYLREYAKSKGLITSEYDIKNTNCKSIHITTGTNKNQNPVLNELRSLNLIGNKHIPDAYKFNDRESRLRLLAGLIDTDGWYELKNGYLCFSQSSERKHIVYDAAFIARSLGIKCTVTTKLIKDHNLKGKIIKGGNTEYRLILLNNHESIPVKIERKKVTCIKRSQLDPLSTRFSVEYYGYDKYYGFTLDKDNLFLLEDFTICHNSFPDITTVWNTIRPSVEDGGRTFGLIVGQGTGGDKDSKFAGLKKMFYDPDSFNILPIENSWDEGLEGQKCCFFVPEYANLSTIDSEGKRLYMDEDGNTLEAPAIKFVLENRGQIKDQEMLDKYIAEHPLTPQESMLDYGGNIFPKKQLMAHLASILSNKKLSHHKQVGELDYVGGALKWTIKDGGDVTEYPLREGMDKTGSIVIWEHPDREPPNGLYIIGVDPYDFDTAVYSSSLGSAIVYKRFQNFESYYDLPVAEYTGRPTAANDFYENVRKLALYYNAKILYENEKKGFHTYLVQKHYDHLLVDQPDILSDIVKGSKVNRKKGIHMSTPIIDWSIGKVNEWLREEFSPGHMNLEKIFSVPLLQELIAYNPKGNFDRVRAFQCVMILKEQMHNKIVKDNKEEERAQSLFDFNLFSENKF